MSARAALAAAIALAAAPAPAAHAQARASLPTIERQVMCVTCRIPLNVAESPQADRERAYIQALIDQGRSEAQIKRALVSQYGSSALALPAAHGFDLAAYLVPGLAVLALACGLVLVLVRWRRRTPLAAGAAAGPAISEEDAARLDADLARYD